MKKVALFTTFYEAKSGYSLIAVAETQIRMLLDHGYDPAVLVQENFEETDGVWSSKVIDLRPTVPFLHLTSDVSDDFKQRVKSIKKALAKSLEDVNVCITHDIILQDFYREHNVAMRHYAKSRPDLLWLHWIHSCPTPNPEARHKYPESCRYTPPPGYIIYPNFTDLSLVCQTYGLNGTEWKAKACRAAHSIDPLLAWPYDKLTKDLAKGADLLNGDVVVVYPARLDRGKQPEKIVRLMVGVQRAGYEPRLLIVDWQSAGARFQTYIDELLDLAASYGLKGKVNFTSRLDDRCSQGVPRHVVVGLTDLSNVYVHPSSVETYSLVVHDAALRGCLLCLNHDLPMMRELYGDVAMYFDFGSDRNERTYEPNEQAFWDDEAKRLIAELRQNRAVMAKTRARREWTPQALWSEFEPLMYLQPVGE